MLRKSVKGFTLIEILIVVAIIGILASVVIVGLGPAQQRGRDARRASDLRSVQTALELYYNKYNQYPTGIVTWKGADNTSIQGALKNADIGITVVPVDPSSGQDYMYASDSAGTTYILGAKLEDKNNSLLSNPTPFPQGQFSGTQGFTSCASPIYCLSL